MKKLHLLSVMIVCAAITNIRADITYPGKITEEQARKIEDVQWEKIARQRELARPSVYKMLDAAIQEEIPSYEYEGEPGEGEQVLIKDPRIMINWPVIFNILDSMRGIISVNEYRTVDYEHPLLYIAIKTGNVLAAKTLLEKYKANPNALAFDYAYKLSDVENTKDSLLTVARKKGNKEMINLLIKYGAK